MTTYYKVLAENGSAYHGGKGKWDLPKDGNPGKWESVQGDIEPCYNGLHVCEKQDLVHWLGPAIFICETDGYAIRHNNKSVVRKARLVQRVDTWNDRTARLFAADCAERAVNQWQKASGKKCDPRTRSAIRAARDFAEGNITAMELSAASSAARSAAYSAADWADRSAASSAARSAADWAAYSAASSAARSAASSAADWADRSAASSAASSAARSAASSAASSAARKWQTKRLFEYLDGKRGAPKAGS